MFTKMGYGVYFFFAALMLCSVVFVWFLIPETKGIPLESMDRLFELPVRKAHKIVMLQRRSFGIMQREQGSVLIRRLLTLLRECDSVFGLIAWNKNNGESSWENVN
jgi:hypothetical protein